MLDGHKTEGQLKDQRGSCAETRAASVTWDRSLNVDDYS